MTPGLYHIHRRKKLGFYPYKEKWLRVFDRLLIVIAILGPIVSIPQILKIFVHHSAGDISLFTYVALLIMNVPWIFYGIFHKEKPIAITYSLWFISNLLITIGAIIYS